MGYTVEEARTWTLRAERAAKLLQRLRDDTWRPFLESTIKAARGVVRGVAPRERRSVWPYRPIPTPPPNVDRPA